MEIELQLASASVEELELLDQFDVDTGRWKLPLVGLFWETIKAAHKDGLTGANKRIVIIDAMPDISIPALSSVKLHTLVDDAPHPHGTLVALLARTAAPDAEIIHYAICKGNTPQLPALMRAVSEALALDADTLCLSLGAVQKMEPGPNAELASFVDVADYIGAARYLTGSEPEMPVVTSCGFPECLCALIAQGLRPTSPVVLCAAGNDAGLFCPARAPETISIGFQTERVWFENGHEKRAWQKPDFVQSGLLDYTVLQLEGAIGSSFAAPLVAGALALRETPRPVRDLLRANEVSAMAQDIEKDVNLWTERKEDVPLWVARQLATIYDLAFDPHGDVGNFDISATRRLEARLFFASTVMNKGLVLKDCRELGLLDRAINMFHWTAWLMPWDPAPRANIASSLLSIADAGPKLGMEKREIAKLLLQAKTLFDQVLDIHPDNEAYVAGLRDTHVLMTQLLAADQNG